MRPIWLAQAAEQGADLVLVLGGDGTVNEVANGLAHSGVALGVLPAGTANVLAMELGLGSHLESRDRAAGTCVSAAHCAGPSDHRRRSLALLPLHGRRGPGRQDRQSGRLRF